MQVSKRDVFCIWDNFQGQKLLLICHPGAQIDYELSVREFVEPAQHLSTSAQSVDITLTASERTTSERLNARVNLASELSALCFVLVSCDCEGEGRSVNAPRIDISFRLNCRGSPSRGKSGLKLENSKSNTSC